MRISRAAISAASIACLFVTVPVGTASAAPIQAAAAGGVSAFYEMNEAPGATVMHDSGGNGVDGAIDPTGVQTGAVVDGATGYNWVHRAPEAAPPSPERVIQVPDNINLEPGDQPFTIEIRYRTKENFGNITQKGQSASKGGQWKIQNPQGIPSCLFKGSGGQVATSSITPLNDEQWHTLTCVLTSSSVEMYVDGVFRNRKNGSAGTIDNKIPMTVGGKINCDQVDITCDYFSGQIDYIKITKGDGAGNVSPVADFSSSCSVLTCEFDSSGSRDPDGSIGSRSWSFGDGATSSAANPTHDFAVAGSYAVTLTVTDNEGASNSVTQTVVAPGEPVQSAIGFVGSAASTGNDKNPTVAAPAGTAAGQRLVLALSMNNLSRTVSAPTGITGWTQLDSVEAKTMSTTVWTKVAAAGDSAAQVSVPMSGAAKYTLTVGAYEGVDPATPAFARSVDVGADHTTRSAPAVNVPAGAWVLSYWADKSSSTGGWAPQASVTSRSQACAEDSGRICSALADSAAAVPAGSYGPITATTDAPSDMATMWSIVLAPAA